MNQQQSRYDALRTAEYRKSSLSSGPQECVAIGRADGWAGVLDTKQANDDKGHDVLALPGGPFGGFLTAVKSGRFDL